MSGNQIQFTPPPTNGGNVFGQALQLIKTIPDAIALKHLEAHQAIGAALQHATTNGVVDYRGARAAVAKSPTASLDYQQFLQNTLTQQSTALQVHAAQMNHESNLLMEVSQAVANKKMSIQEGRSLYSNYMNQMGVAAPEQSYLLQQLGDTPESFVTKSQALAKTLNGNASDLVNLYRKNLLPTNLGSTEAFPFTTGSGNVGNAGQLPRSLPPTLLELQNQQGAKVPAIVNNGSAMPIRGSGPGNGSGESPGQPFAGVSPSYPGKPGVASPVSTQPLPQARSQQTTPSPEQNYNNYLTQKYNSVYTTPGVVTQQPAGFEEAQKEGVSYLNGLSASLGNLQAAQQSLIQLQEENPNAITGFGAEVRGPLTSILALGGFKATGASSTQEFQKSAAQALTQLSTSENLGSDYRIQNAAATLPQIKNTKTASSYLVTSALGVVAAKELAINYSREIQTIPGMTPAGARLAVQAFTSRISPLVLQIAQMSPKNQQAFFANLHESSPTIYKKDFVPAWVGTQKAIAEAVAGGKLTPAQDPWYGAPQQ